MKDLSKGRIRISTCLSSSSVLKSKAGGGDMLSSLDGGVAGFGCGRAISLPLARYCWCSRVGRKGELGITCILQSLGFRFIQI